MHSIFYRCNTIIYRHTALLTRGPHKIWNIEKLRYSFKFDFMRELRQIHVARAGVKTSLMYTRASSIILQMLCNQEDGCIIGARGAWLCETGRWRKWADGALRGRSAQAQVQVRGYKEEKLGLAVRTLCFICPSYRSHDRSQHPPHFLSRRNFSRCVCNCTLSVAFVRRFPRVFPAKHFDKLDSSLTRQRTTLAGES